MIAVLYIIYIDISKLVASEESDFSIAASLELPSALGSNAARPGKPGGVAPGNGEKDLMPGRWVGGKGSVASPVKDQIIEGQIVDDEGRPNGNVLILIKRIYTPGELGRFVLADYISASAADFRRWIESDDGKVSQVDGSYHFCKVESKNCTAVSSLDICVHVGKLRVWKEDELINKGISEFGKAGNLLISRFFKKDPSQPTPPGHLPWDRKHPPGDLRVGPGGGRKKDEGTDKRDDKANQGMIQKALAVEGKRRKAISQLEKQLAELKKNVGAEEPADDKAKKKKKKKKKKKSSSSAEGELEDKAEDKPFEAGDDKRRKKGPKRSPSPDWGGDDGDSEDSGESESDSEESDDDEPGEGDDPNKPGGGKKGVPPEKKKVKKKDKRGKKDKKKKEKKSKRKGRKKKQKLEKDKGPFGVGESQRMVKDKSSSEEDSSEDSDESSQSFRKAPSGLTLHLRLQRYAMKHPGRLASRLLQKMERATRFEGARRKPGSQVKVVPCAVNFYLAIMTPSMKDKWSPRTQRELRIWTEVLDCLAAKENAAAADIAAQRIKALEQSVQDNNQWRKAKYLELVDSEEVTLADKGEANMMQKEVELEEKLRGKGQWSNPNWDKKGKGEKGEKGKGKGKKETPAAEAAKK